MFAASEETIAAPISAPGRGAVSLLRVSGPAVQALIPRLLARGSRVLDRPRSAVYTELLDLSIQQGDGSFPVLDSVIAQFFRAPHSFTGEDVLEIAVHGSPFIVSRALDGIRSAGVRLARPGEFSERAFSNGKLDLSQAEAIADLVASETEIQARVAREQLEGRLSSAVNLLGEPLRNLLSEIEAHIDFPDEDIEPLARNEWSAELCRVERSIMNFKASYSVGRVCREGALVVLSGAPNAGKSSLLNRLLGEDRAIVTAIPGTTRDTIEEVASFDGLAVRLCDTAGLAFEEETLRELDEVEKLGVERSLRRLGAADIALFVVDVTSSLDQKLLARVRAEAREVLLVGNKCDLLDTARCSLRLEEITAETGLLPIAVSAQQGEGIADLRSAVRALLLPVTALEGGSVLVTNQRHYEALASAEESLGRANEGLVHGFPPEFVAADIRSALGALSDIVGVTSTEELLGRIFSKFCIGK